MNKHIFLQAFAAVFLLLAMTVASLFSVPSSYRVQAQSANTCPNTGSGWVKVEGNQSSYTAPAGFTVDQVCVKGGEDNQDNGYLITSPPDSNVHVCQKQAGPNLKVETLTINGIGTNSVSFVFTGDEGGCADVSHASYHLQGTAASPDPEASPVPTPVPSPDPESSPDPEASPTPSPRVVASPVPSPSVTASPTPSPQACVVQSSLSTTGMSCSVRDFEAKYTLKNNNGQAVQGTKVIFTYGSKTQEATTDSNGEAKVRFGYEGNMSVSANPEGVEDCATQSAHVTAPDNCPAVGGPSGEVLGTSTAQGEILGATTMAETGSVAEVLFQGVGLLGSVSTLLGTALVARRHA